MDIKPPLICLLADAHGLYDDRIYWKEACSLKKAGFDVYYIYAGDEEKTGVTNEGIDYSSIRKDHSANRWINFILKRISPHGLYARMLRKASELKANAYHIHDLNILRLAASLKEKPWHPKIIYDVHEPYPENIVDYDHGPVKSRFLRKILAAYIRRQEKRLARSCDLIITTESNLQKRFMNYFPDKPVEIIYNYTNLNPDLNSSSQREKNYDAIYTGGITKLRGAWNTLEAVRLVTRQLTGFKMLFIGSYFPSGLKQEMKNYLAENKLKENVVLMDSVPYAEISSYYSQSRIGLGIFLPIETHRIILQIKIFEYLNFGLPIVGSNFGHIHSIISRHNCGITVDPESPEAIAAALIELSSNKKLYEAFQQNAIKASPLYRWEIMEEKLINLYKHLIPKE